MGDTAPLYAVSVSPKNWRLLRIVLAIGLPPFLPQLVQLGITGSLENIVDVSESSPYSATLVPSFINLPGSALIGIGWAVGGFLFWWYDGRAGNLLVWLAALAVAGAIGGYAAAYFGMTPAYIGAVYGFAVGFVDWCLLKILPLERALAVQRHNAATTLNPVGRSRSWRSARMIVAIGLPPIPPYVALLVFAGPIMSNLTIEPYEIVNYSHVVFAMIPVAWVLGGLMVWRNFDRRRGPLFWLSLFAVIGTMLGISVMGISRDYQLYALVGGTLAGLLIWLALRASKRWHGRNPGALFAWLVTSGLISVAGVLIWLGLPLTSYFFKWMFPTIGAGGGAATGLMMWGMLRWAR